MSFNFLINFQITVTPIHSNQIKFNQQAHDEYAPQLTKALQTILEGTGHDLLNKALKLELYTSSNFMGFFVAEEDANCLKRLALQYVKEISHSSKFFEEFFSRNLKTNHKWFSLWYFLKC